MSYILVFYIYTIPRYIHYYCETNYFIINVTLQSNYMTLYNVIPGDGLRKPKHVVM
jgi:hypothetical protein